MALSVLFSVLPFFFFTSGLTFVYASLVGLLVSCMTYQPATGVYIVMAAFLAFSMILNGIKIRNVLHNVLLSVLCFLLALIIFRLFLINKADAGTVSHVFGAKNIVTGLFSNIRLYMRQTFWLYGNLFTKALLALSAVLFVVNAAKRSGGSLAKGFAFLALAVLFLLVTWALSYGAMLVFDNMFIGPRYFLAFSAFVALVVFANCGLTGIFGVVAKACAVLLVYANIVFFNMYSSVLVTQGKYNDFRMDMLIADLNEFRAGEGECALYFEGSIGYSQAVSSEFKQYPALSYLIGTANNWREYEFRNRNFTIYELDEKPEGAILVKETFYHNIYALPGSGKTFIIRLKPGL